MLCCNFLQKKTSEYIDALPCRIDGERTALIEEHASNLGAMRAALTEAEHIAQVCVPGGEGEGWKEVACVYGHVHEWLEIAQHQPQATSRKKLLMKRNNSSTASL